MKAVAGMAEDGHVTLVPRPRAEIEEYFAGWEPVEPVEADVAPVLARRPDGEPPADPQAAYYWAGAARKP
ncbi:hypothetical protein [Kitasatospora cystarginea]